MRDSLYFAEENEAEVPALQQAYHLANLSGFFRSVASPSASAVITVCRSLPHALFNLSKLAVWWLRLAISIERIQWLC
jgi:hypothetical protein